MQIINLHLFTLISLLTFITLNISVYGQKTNVTKSPLDDDDDLTLPPFTLNPIVDFFHEEPEVEEEEKHDNETSVDEPKNIQNTFNAGRLFTKFLQRPTPENSIPDNATHEEIYIRLSHLLDDEIDVLTKEILPHALEYQQSRVKISPPCTNSLLNLASALREKTSWAYKFFDSSGGIPSGLLEGTLSNFGSFDQCLEAGIRENDSFIGTDLIQFNGSYCLVELLPPLPDLKSRLTFNSVILNYTGTELEKTFFTRWSTYVHYYYSYPLSVGVCMPSSCSASEIQLFMQSVAKQYRLKVQVGPNCIHKYSAKINDFPIVSVSIISSLIILTLIATFSHYLLKYNNDTDELKSNVSSLRKLFHCFSIINSISILLNDKNNDHKRQSNDMNDNEIVQDERNRNKNNNSNNMINDALKPLAGIRVLALVWLIMTDVYLLGGLPLENIVKNVHSEMRGKGKSIAFQLIINGWSFISEIFFFLSGFLIAYKAILALKNKKNFNIIKTVLYRWIQWTPTVLGAIMILFIMFNPFFGSGPIFDKHSLMIEQKCKHNWWANILYISNWLSIDEMCFEPMWFLSASFQLYIISCIVILSLHKRPILGSIISLTFILIGIIVPGFTTFIFKLPPTFFFNNPFIKQTKEDMELSFFPTFNHFSSYFIGILLGYIVVNKITKGKRMNSFVQLLLLIITIALSLSSILITVQWNNLIRYPTYISSILYSSFHRIVWIFGVACISCTSVYDHQGFLAKILSAKLFTTVNRLSLHIYLNHYLIIWYHYLSIRNVISYQHSDMLMTAAGVCLQTLLMSMVTFCIFDAPVKSFFQLLASFKVNQYLNKGINNTTDIPIKTMSTTASTAANIETTIAVINKTDV